MQKLLIEKWFPVYEVSHESARERGAQFPPIYQLHIWWARRPQTASRIASVLASIPLADLSEKEKKQLLWALGLRGDPIKAEAERLKGKRRFNYPPFERIDPESRFYHEKMIELWGRRPVGADFMAGGGAIPFEMIRAGFGEVIAGEYNPVAYIILKASLEYPLMYGDRLVQGVEKYGRQILNALRSKVAKYYPKHSRGQPVDYIWTRMFRCTECGIEIPSLKTLWLDKKNHYAIYPTIVENKVNLNVVRIEEIGKIKVGRREESKVRIVDGEFKGVIFETKGYERDGELECPKHRHTVSQDKVKEQYKEHLAKGEMEGYPTHHPIRLVAAFLRGGTYVEPTDYMKTAFARAEEDLKKAWDELINEDLIPLEIHEKGEADRIFKYGIDKYYKMFNARQLLVHAELVRLIKGTYDKMIENEVRKGRSTEIAKKYSDAIVTCLTLALGKTLDYNSVLTIWDSNAGKIVHTFDTHAYAWTWDFGEGDMIHEDKGIYEWALSNFTKALKGIVKRLWGYKAKVKVVFGDAKEKILEENTTTNGYDVMFIDPPYYGNVQYGEVSDYFYVWFRKTLRGIYPDAFLEPLTPKQEEAVANRVRHGSKALASSHYENKMKQIFSSVYNELRHGGVFLLWFAHKTGVAWSRTIRALLDSGFGITGMWGVRSEMERSLHISGKAALRTSVIMVCRKRENGWGYIQDVMRELDEHLEQRLNELDEWGIIGPDFLMGAQADALRIASKYWPIKDPAGKIYPGQALDLILDRATGLTVNYITRKVAPQVIGVDATTKFYILAKYLYADLVPYDDARRLALACLGASGIRDPAEEVVVQSGIGKIATQQVRGERAKVVKLMEPWERVKGGSIFGSKPTPIIDWIHAAVSDLEEAKILEEVAVHIAKGGPNVCEVLRVLYHILPDEITKQKKTIKNKEKIHVKTLLFAVCEEGLHLAVKREMEKKETQKTIEEYLGEEP